MEAVTRADAFGMNQLLANPEQVCVLLLAVATQEFTLNSKDETPQACGKLANIIHDA
jgi:hypothetical protein